MSLLERDILTPSIELFSKCYRAFLECSDEVQAGIREMVKIIEDPATDADDRAMAIESIAEALFPGLDDGALGIDIDEADRAAARNSPEGERALREADAEEAAFADRLRDVLDKKGWTQQELASRSGVGQPAISMMLSRNCRPQKRTIRKLAEALGVPEMDLWPQVD